MSQTQEASILDRILDPLSRCLDDESARRVLEMGVDPEVRARVAWLAERANEGLLTPEERAEYDVYINADDFITVLKMKATHRLGRGVPARWTPQLASSSAIKPQTAANIASSARSHPA